MEATRRFVAHLAGHSRTFEVGETVPAEWAATVGAPHLLAVSAIVPSEPTGEAPPLPGGPDGRSTVAEVVAWVDAAPEPGERRARAAEARTIELAGRNRASLLNHLADVLGPDPGIEP